MDIKKNFKLWNETYDWSRGGEEWSGYWGSSQTQWREVILPRIQTFLPADSILEIAPGFGRWTEYLKDRAKELTLVDLSNKCIEACRKRFEAFSHLRYFSNDGISLEMVPDGHFDFIFSFDSLVHAEDEVIKLYVRQIARKLKPGGSAFIHHSNLGEYAAQLKIQAVLGKVPKLLRFFKKLGIFDELHLHARAQSMTAEKMRRYAAESGLQCVRQELINWESKGLVDCMSTLTGKCPNVSGDTQIIKNPRFMGQGKKTGSG